MSTESHKPGITKAKDPAATLDYSIDLAAYLEGRTITAANVTASPAGLTVGAQSFAGSIIKARLSGGTLNATYAVTYNFTLSTGEIDERSINIFIQNR